jgi:hypothetical protein
VISPTRCRFAVSEVIQMRIRSTRVEPDEE